MTDGEHDDIRGRLAAAGVRTVMGTAVDAAGITLAKTVPLAKIDTFATVGLGAAPVWHVFCIDAAIAFTDSITAVGDQRLRLDTDSVRLLGDGLAWGATQYFSQHGEPAPACTRGLLRRIERSLAAQGLSASVGHELEFVLVAADGSALDSPSWVPYGTTGLLDHEGFVADLLAAAGVAGLEVEQLHAEYGPNQFEMSFAPRTPVAAADDAVLAKVLIGRTARRHGLRASFSPVPFVGSVGNGAHQHVSLARDGAPLFDGGSDEMFGVTGEGAAAIGGLVGGLCAIQGLLTGSVLSGHRVAPGLWSGAHIGWGLENRETAVRFVQGGPSNPYGANVEIKIIDPSANVYTASAAVLATALDGIVTKTTVPAPITEDPSQWSTQRRVDAGVDLLPDDVGVILDNLDASVAARALVGDAVVDTVVATRRHEQAEYGDKPAEEVAKRFRLAWSI